MHIDRRTFSRLVALATAGAAVPVSAPTTTTSAAASLIGRTRTDLERANVPMLNLLLPGRMRTMAHSC